MLHMGMKDILLSKNNAPEIEYMISILHMNNNNSRLLWSLAQIVNCRTQEYIYVFD